MAHVVLITRGQRILIFLQIRGAFRFIVHNFSNKGVLELKLPKKIIFNKKCAPKHLFFIEKK